VELHNLYLTPNIIKVLKSRRASRTHGEWKLHTKF